MTMLGVDSRAAAIDVLRVAEQVRQLSSEDLCAVLAAFPVLTPQGHPVRLAVHAVDQGAGTRGDA